MAETFKGPAGVRCSMPENSSLKADVVRTLDVRK